MYKGDLAIRKNTLWKKVAFLEIINMTPLVCNKHRECIILSILAFQYRAFIFPSVYICMLQCCVLITFAV